MVVIADSPIQIYEGQNSVTTEVKCEVKDLDMNGLDMNGFVFELAANR